MAAGYSLKSLKNQEVGTISKFLSDILKDVQGDSKICSQSYTAKSRCQNTEVEIWQIYHFFLNVKYFFQIWNTICFEVNIDKMH